VPKTVSLTVEAEERYDNIIQSDVEMVPNIIEPRKATIEELILMHSRKYGVSAYIMRKIIHCESSGSASAIGDFGQSFGLVQIHLPSHPYVTQAQALDPEFAISFLAKNLSLGKGSMWTCYRMLELST